MATDPFYETIKPTVYLARAYALVPFSLESGTLQLLNLTITTVVTSYYVYGITEVYSSMYHNPILPKFEKMMLILQVTATSSVAISSWLVNHLWYKDIVSTLKKLLNVESLLVSQDLHVDVKYRRKLQLQFIVTIAFFSLQNVMDNFILGENIIALFIIYTIAMLTLSHFLLLICLCRRYYSFINDKIKTLGELSPEGLADIFKLSEEMNSWGRKTIPFQNRNSFKHSLKTVMECHSELFIVCGSINKYFGLQILLNVTANMLNVTSICYYVPAIVIDESDKPHHYMIISIKSVSFIALFAFSQLWIMAHICSSTCDEANSTGILVHGISNQPKFSCFSIELDAFYTQLLHQRINFSAHGFFAIDFTLINTVIGVVITYIVILIQFQMSNETPKSTNSTAVNMLMENTTTNML
ncbi:putative gustatory receptor 28b [Macrosteles quadrilineatus]|uniref:putative gustatory receptor 28b n=1 Tax=Macrosteles quadrilineatus TaxID=74068 RepID=UPI0023E1B3A2|nr:putative gustatory receptor 28b [Macrosteles quadrilineatus]